MVTAISGGIAKLFNALGLRGVAIIILLGLFYLADSRAKDWERRSAEKDAVISAKDQEITRHEAAAAVSAASVKKLAESVTSMVDAGADAQKRAQAALVAQSAREADLSSLAASLRAQAGALGKSEGDDCSTPLSVLTAKGI